MASFSGLGIGLSFLFGCILLGLVAELYHILWWKKRISNRLSEDQYSSSIATEISYVFFCWRKPNSLTQNHGHRENAATIRNSEANGHEQDLEQGAGKDLLLEGFGEEGTVESELMRLHNLCGPPRFLFTINEETKEDLESEDGKSKGDKGSRTRRSLSDLNISPFLTPLSSPPPVKAYAFDSYSHNHGFNPLFESNSEAELNRLRSSPPPKFKFLRDAEEKLMKMKGLKEEAEKRAGGHNQDSATPKSAVFQQEEKDGSFLFSFTGKKYREREVHHQLPLFHSQILPLASSPSAFRPLN